MIAFAQPFGLIALLAVPLAWLLARIAARRHAAADARYGGGPTIRPTPRPAVAWTREVLLLLALGALALAIARPTWGRAPTPLVRRGIDVAIALDVSRSMTATDVQPSRAAAAASGLRRLLRALPGDRAGLVTFAGTAFLRSPLTLDLDALGQLVAQAQGEPGLVDRGTDLALALEGALATLDVEDRAATQVVVLVSDGEHVGRDLDVAVRHARDLGVRVYAVAAGTEAGASLGGDPRAGPDVSRLERATLERIASDTGGSTRDLATIAGLAVEFSRLRQTTFEGAEEEAPIERFPWFLGTALLLLVTRSLVQHVPGIGVGRRRRLAEVGALALLLGACGGTAAWRAVDEGNHAFAGGRFEQALTAYERAAQLMPDEVAITYNQGNTLHALRRYEEATVASLAAAERAADGHLRGQARYALGNHAFRRGDLQAARDAYVAVLLADPTDEDARYNLELVLLLNAEQNPTPQQGAPQPGQPPAGQPPDPQTGPPQPGQPQPGGPGDAQPGEGAPGPQNEAEAQAALQSAAAELGENVTLEEALAVLDRLRALNAFERIEDRGRSGSLPDR